jgi:hypothetical protein
MEFSVIQPLQALANLLQIAMVKSRCFNAENRKITALSHGAGLAWKDPESVNLPWP